MVIVHVLAPARVGGLERVVQGLARGHAPRGHQVHVVAVGPEADLQDFFAPLQGSGVTTHALSLGGRAYLRERRMIRGLCRSLAPSVMHTHGYRPDIVDAGVARTLGIPTVTTVHGFIGGDLKLRIYESLQVRAFHRFDAVVAVSRAMATDLRRRGVSENRLQMIPNAWAGGAPLTRAEARRVLGLSPQRWIAGWVGRLGREKGADVALDAMVGLADAGVDLSVIGDGEARVELQARAASAGLDGQVTWHGMVPDAGRLLAAFDVFVLSSRTEGTPIALFEAMAASVPIVATRVGGVPDVVGDKEALLVAPEDPAALAAAVRAVRNDPEAARERAWAARERLQRDFAPEPWLAAYESLYARLARGREAA